MLDRTMPMILEDGTILCDGVELGKVAQAHDGTWGIYITFSHHDNRNSAVAEALDRIDELVGWQPPSGFTSENP